MPEDDVYELYIDALTPATIPMARLSEYMADFAEILGNQEHVHFEGVKQGSLSIACRVEPMAHRGSPVPHGSEVGNEGLLLAGSATGRRQRRRPDYAAQVECDGVPR
jgi:hypothetical protein